jgi:hypothetical protein
MTREELLSLLRNSELPEFCITDEYLSNMLTKSDIEIHAEIADINSFWDQHYTQHRYGQSAKK